MSLAGRGCNRRTGPRECVLERIGWGWRRRESGVIEFDGAVGYGGDEEGVVGFRPGDVVDAVGGVEGGEFGDSAAGERERTWRRPLPRMPKFWAVATARRFS